jgi:DNA-nicking Smr family endonuclease
MARAELSKADQRLWAAFTETILLLPGRARLPVETPPAAAASPAVAAPGVPAPLALPPTVRANGAPAGLDKATWKKFSSGKIKAVLRLDLHGMTAARAHRAVTHFIERAVAEEARCVEIITGKGEVLARELPHWLGAPGVRGVILAMAHPHAGNTGSVKILLRRVRAAISRP